MPSEKRLQDWDLFSLEKRTGDGEAIGGHSSAQHKDSREQGDIRAKDIPPEYKKENVHHEGVEASQQGPSELVAGVLRHFPNLTGEI